MRKLMMCECAKCYGKKQWGHPRKPKRSKSSFILSLIFVDSLIWFVVADSIHAMTPIEPLVFENRSLARNVAEIKALPMEVSQSTQIQNGEGVDENSIEGKIRNAFPEDSDTAVAIAKCESQLDPTRIRDTHMQHPSIGLFQINQTWHKYSTETLQNPDENIRIAKEIKGRWGNWNAWSCYKFGYYQKYI